MIRLQKWLAMSGIASRRRAESLIFEGRVKLNGKTVVDVGTKACPESDMVELDGKLVDIESEKVYIMLHKPEGFITSVQDQFGRSTVMELVPQGVRLYPVGRLDQDTSGLLLFTNDGDFAQKLTHPKHEVQKVYQATVKGTPTVQSLDNLRKGVVIEGKKTAPAKVRFLGKPRNSSDTRLEITIHEGRNRQVRKMCDAIGHRVVNLKRVQVGPLELGALKKGQWRALARHEIKVLLNL